MQEENRSMIRRIQEENKSKNRRIRRKWTRTGGKEKEKTMQEDVK